MEFLLNVRNGKGVLDPKELGGMDVIPLAPKVLEKMERMEESVWIEGSNNIVYRRICVDSDDFPRSV